MKAIFGGVLKKKLIKLITELGIGVLEIVIDIPTSVTIFHSVEYLAESKKIMLHRWEEDDIELSYDFDDLDNEDKLEVLRILSEFL